VRLRERVCDVSVAVGDCARGWDGGEAGRAFQSLAEFFLSALEGGFGVFGVHAAVGEAGAGLWRVCGFQSISR